MNVGPPNTQQSAITGGETRALLAVRAGTIGSPAGIPTLVQAGLDPHADIKRSALTRKRLKMNEDKAKLEQLLEICHAVGLSCHVGQSKGVSRRSPNLTHRPRCRGQDPWPGRSGGGRP